MTSGRPVTVAVDAVGGDEAPAAVLAGVTDALEADPALTVALVGPEGVVAPFEDGNERLLAVAAEEVIGMDEQPAAAVRAKKASSIVVGCRLVAEGVAQAFFSAGNTGAAMTAATLVMGRVEGVARPAIAAVIPASDRPVVLLDVGAQADAKPENLVQFAHMGAAYADIVLGAVNPRVALLNIGEEPSKGSSLTKAAYELMSAQVPGFIGNAEGRDIPAGRADVIVTDGFTGNVCLKLLEGLAKSLLSQVRDAMTANLPGKVAASVLKPSLRRLKERIDPDTYGGAPLLGVAGVCIIGHGSSGPRAVSSALRVAAQAVRGDLPGRISEAVSEAG
ncbi:MAG: phosphate acyltransferase PlsX [Coriobacteriia bacterium]|nr:phosphate acyltransferase PlsX [Coriobacteriia bacterium]